MKRNFIHVFHEITGEAINYKEGVPLTMQVVAVNALQNAYSDETLDGSDQIKRYDLAIRIHAGGVVEVTSEEIALIKRLINKAYKSPIIVAPAWKILDADWVEAPAEMITDSASA